MRIIAFVILKILSYVIGITCAQPRKSADSCDSSTDETVVDCSRSSLENVPFVTLSSNSFKV
uniref:Uncharacterized protein n=1 Tax=Romanomermis culicivorax TaxID=13658 RepID=A0A915LB79_ROMCU